MIYLFEINKNIVVNFIFPFGDLFYIIITGGITNSRAANYYKIKILCYIYKIHYLRDDTIIIWLRIPIM